MDMYASREYYLNTHKEKKIPITKITERLKEASRHIDTLTYNRIVGKGFEHLTKFQQEIIKEVVCQLAIFEYENADMLKTPFSSYSINGVLMNFDTKWNVQIQNGVAIPMDSYCLLAQTGLTCRNLRY